MKFQKEHISWNLGLTKETDERVKNSAENLSKTRKKLFSEKKLVCPTRLELDSDLTKNLYLKEKKSLKEIGEIMECSPKTIKKRLIEQRIEIRGTKEYTVGKKRIPFTEQHKKNMAISKIGENNPSKRPEVREKISKIKKITCVGENNPFYGKHHSEETKKEQRENKKRLYSEGKLTSAVKLKLDEKEIINLYNESKSLKDISNIIGYSVSPIKRILKSNNINILASGEVNRRLYSEGKIINHARGKTKENYEPLRRVSLSMKERRKNIIFPKRDTPIELKIQNFLSLLHIEYIAHKYISEITQSYQCDIFVPSMKLILEADGCYWHGCKICNKKINERQEKQIEKDNLRTQELQEKGYRVIRLWEHEIKSIDLENFQRMLI